MAQRSRSKPQSSRSKRLEVTISRRPFKIEIMVSIEVLQEDI